MVDTRQLITALSVPDAYPRPPGSICVIQTHASVVFLTDDEVFKVKKPKSFGFLDYSTLERRHRFCQAEVALNRRLAPSVYHGVLPITRTGDRLTIDGAGSIVDYAVHMRRLSEADTFAHRLALGALPTALLDAVADRIAVFHRAHTPDPAAARWSSPTDVRTNFDDNFADLDSAMPSLVGPTAQSNLATLRTDAFVDVASVIADRYAADWACDGHGDLRTDHVYVHTNADGVHVDIVDCIEFDARYRCGDPIADIAFLAMDLRAHGGWLQADHILERYLASTGDAAGRQLLPFYCGYRAMVRAKVEWLRSTLAEVDTSDRAAARQSARRHLLLALGELSAPDRRPALVLIGGLPASGKSTVAASLHRDHNFVWIRADIVRKQLAGLEPDAPARADIDAGLYSRAHSDRTYAACLDRAREVILDGGRALIDATFVESSRRAPFFALANDLAVRGHMIVCQADDATSRHRLATRDSGPSDADVSVYEALRKRWEPPRTPTSFTVVDSGTTLETTLTQATDALRQHGLADSSPP